MTLQVNWFFHKLDYVGIRLRAFLIIIIIRCSIPRLTEYSSASSLSAAIFYGPIMAFTAMKQLRYIYLIFKEALIDNCNPNASCQALTHLCITQITYLAVIVTLCIITVVLTMAERFATPSFRPLRAGLFVALGCFGILPVSIHPKCLFTSE